MRGGQKKKIIEMSGRAVDDLKMAYHISPPSLSVITCDWSYTHTHLHNVQSVHGVYVGKQWCGENRTAQGKER